MAEEIVGDDIDYGEDSLAGAARLIEDLMSEAPQTEGAFVGEGVERARNRDMPFEDIADGPTDAAVRSDAPTQVDNDPIGPRAPVDDPKPQQLKLHVPQLARAMLSEFSDLKTEEDLARLGAENPIRYNRFLLMRDQLERAVSEQRKSAKQNAAGWQESEATALADAMPELRDPARAPRLIAELRAFARRNGYTQEQLAKASAKDWTLLSKAMRFEAANTDSAARLENARRRTATPASVQRPGIAREHLREESLRSDYQRLRKTGYVRDAANVIRQIMN